MRIRIRGLDAVIENLRNKKNKTPMVIESIGRKVSLMAARELVKAAQRSGLKRWRGDLFGKTKPVRQSKYEWGVSIPIHGFYQDNYGFKREYYVSLKRGRTITKWAKSKGLYQKGIRKLKVKTHPFRDKAERVIDRKMRNIIRQEFRKLNT